MTLPILLLSPWIVLGLYLAARVRLPRPLPPAPGSALPPVSVIVPARNEERNVEACLESLAASSYPDFEVLLVDDRSDDRTAELARGVPWGRARSLRVLPGEPLPEGWLGKPWACHQGAAAARPGSEILVFTDADTRHGTDLLGRVVTALEEDEAHAVTLIGRQLLESFWERVVVPQIFFVIGLRYPGLRRPLPRRRWRDAIANGQFVAVRRGAYEAVGGHGAVKGEVVEDLRLAQELVRGGQVLSVRGAEDAFATRMYTSLGEIVAGFTKNMALGTRQSAPPALRPLALPGALVYLAWFWLAPPLALVPALAGVGGPGLLVWSAAGSACGVLFWTAASVWFGAPARYAPLYPVGAAVAAFIFARSWIRGGRVEWKGRSYAAPAEVGDGGAKG